MMVLVKQYSGAYGMVADSFGGCGTKLNNDAPYNQGQLTQRGRYYGTFSIKLLR